MMNSCEDPRTRLLKVLLRALLLTLPTLALNLIIQGKREFAQELETNKKYREITAETIRKGR